MNVLCLYVSAHLAQITYRIFNFRVICDVQYVQGYIFKGSIVTLFLSVSAGQWVSVEGRFRCVSLTCMSSCCPKSPQGLSPSAHLADGTGDLILVWDTNPLGFLKFLYRHTSTQDQVELGGSNL